jgi:ubiquinone/menaquinone biosynthesis C-methylase UbiE
MSRPLEGSTERISFGESILDFFYDRHASTNAAFFIRYLKPGMKILDCGCGPGSITLDFAELISPGQAVGIDIESKHIERAKALQQERNINNVDFQVADIYKLPFDDGTFDAVFVHGVVEYLKDPEQPFREMRRVLKNDGVLGARHGDWGGFLLATKNLYTKKAIAVFTQIMRKNGGNPRFGRNQHSYIRQAGFLRIILSASYDCWTPTLETARQVGQCMKAYFMSNDFVIAALRSKLIDRKSLAKIQSSFDDWGRDESIFAAEAWGEAVAWKI